MVRWVYTNEPSHDIGLTLSLGSVQSYSKRPSSTMDSKQGLGSARSRSLEVGRSRRAPVPHSRIQMNSRDSPLQSPPFSLPNEQTKKKTVESNP